VATRFPIYPAFLFFLQPLRAAGMPTRLSDGHPKNKELEHSERFHEIHDPFLFSAPPFTAPRKHARVSPVLPVNTAARERLRCARACMICDSPALLPVM
jgi:hypothetical protein